MSLKSMVLFKGYTFESPWFGSDLYLGFFNSLFCTKTLHVWQPNAVKKKSMVRAKVKVGSWLGLCHTKSFLKIYMCNLIVLHALLFISCISLSWKSCNYGFERCNRNTVDMEKVQLTLMLIWCSFMSLWISYSLSLRCEKFYYETHIHRARCHW